MRALASFRTFLAGLAALWSFDLFACGGMMMPADGVELLGSKIRSLGEGLTAADVEMTAYDNGADIGFCYDKLLATNKEARGMLMTTVTINAQGRVSNIKINTRMPRDPHFENCIRSSMQRWQFAQPRGGKDIIASTVYRFEPDYRGLPADLESGGNVMLSDLGPFGK